MSDEIKIEVDHLTDPTADPLIITDGWVSYEVVSDMMSGADQFTVELQPRREYMDFFRVPGHTIRIYLGEHRQLTGIVDASPIIGTTDDISLVITGRDYGGLLVDGAAPMIDLTDRTLQEIVEALVKPFDAYITEVVVDNALRRYKVAGKKDRRKTGKSSPLYQGTAERIHEWRTKPGQKIWDRLQWLAEQVGAHVWMSGSKVCVARPLYDQEPIYRQLYVHIDDEGNVTDSNCTINHSPDIGDRFATWAVVGQGLPAATSYGRDVSEKYGRAIDPSDAFYLEEGGTLQSRIALTTVESIQNIKDTKLARRLARVRMEEAAVESYDMTIDVVGHRQYEDGPLWAVDTVVDLDWQPKRIKAPHYIRRRSFSRTAGEVPMTSLGVIPTDIWLAGDYDILNDTQYNSAQRILWQRYAL
jgi:prophage tail gpP-like protein